MVIKMRMFMIIYDENLDGTFGVAAQEQVVTCGRKLANAALVPSANRVAELLGHFLLHEEKW